jgi:hypothetical protein
MGIFTGQSLVIISVDPAQGLVFLFSRGELSQPEHTELYHLPKLQLRDLPNKIIHEGRVLLSQDSHLIAHLELLIIQIASELP